MLFKTRAGICFRWSNHTWLKILCTEPCPVKRGNNDPERSHRSHAELCPAKWWGLKILNLTASTHESSLSWYPYQDIFIYFSRELIVHGSFGKHFGIYVVKQSGIFPPKHLEASGNVHMISCKKVMPYGRKPFIWLHCCREWKLTGQCYLQGSQGLGQILLTLLM